MRVRARFCNEILDKVAPERGAGSYGWIAPLRVQGHSSAAAFFFCVQMYLLYLAVHPAYSSGGASVGDFVTVLSFYCRRRRLTLLEPSTPWLY